LTSRQRKGLPMSALIRTLLVTFVSLPLPLVHGQMFGPPLPPPNPIASPRERIASCYRSGAINIPMMQACSGLIVNMPDFASCMNGGPCFGEPPLQPAAAGAPFCGSMGLPYCPASRPCGFGDTISCQFAPQCGAPPFPACVVPQPCGNVGSFSCPPPPPPPQYSFEVFRPTFVVSLPPRGPGAGGIHFANPPIPDLNTARNCRATASSEQEFYACLVDSALPEEYRLTQQCLSSYGGDPAAAYICSSGNQQLQNNYQQLQKVAQCSRSSQSNDDSEIALCVGNAFLGDRERYYLGCIQSNKNDYAGIAVCALAPQLNPEQQIALSCAITTGAHPYPFATCTGGRLTAREIEKCWQNGIGTDQGCFGPNNELRKFSQQLDDQARRAFGDQSVAYQAFSFWQNNIAMPGPNHEFVKFLNNGLNDIQHGPGPNNEIIKFSNQVGDALNSLGQAVQCIFGCS
jgi:hypothetical protein